MCDTILIDQDCANNGDCSTCEKKATCSNVEAQDALNRTMKELAKEL